MNRLPVTVAGGGLTGRRMAELRAHFVSRSLVELQALALHLGAATLTADSAKDAVLSLHRMRGTAATLGYKKLAAKAQVLRAALRNGDASSPLTRAGLDSMILELRDLLRVTAAAG